MSDFSPNASRQSSSSLHTQGGDIPPRDFKTPPPPPSSYPEATHIKATPLKHSSITSSSLSIRQKKGAPGHREEMRYATRNKFVSLPVDEFMKRAARCALLDGEHGHEHPLPDCTGFLAVPTVGQLEKDMYEPLCKAINRICREVICQASSEKADKGDKTMQRPDLVMFHRDRLPSDKRPNWPKQEFCIEVKASSTLDDPLDDRKENFHALSEHRQANLEQICAYSDMQWSHQHRAFCFSVMIFGHNARIMRWDRSGALFTKRFDWKQECRILGEFFWRFDHMTDEERGYDPTVRELTNAEVERLRSDLKISEAEFHANLDPSMKYNRFAWKRFKESLDFRYPIAEITMTPESTGRDAAKQKQKQKVYIVGTPVSKAPGLVGRCTRGYAAYDIEEKKVVWLKDAWRVDLPGMEREGDTLQDLQKAGVDHVPCFVCHEDIRGQSTLAYDVYIEQQRSSRDSAMTSTSTLQAEHADNAESTQMRHPATLFLKRHKHYRLVSEDVCLPLDDFATAKELLEIIRDCVKAHSQVYERLNLLHRDISSGNVLIREVVDGSGKVTRQGILSDWELAKKVPRDGEPEVARQVDRSGTWQFMSALAQRNPYKVLNLQDDLESFFHLVVYEGCCWLPISIHQLLGAFMTEYFDDYTVNPVISELVGGALKVATIRSGELVYSDLRILFLSKENVWDNAEDLPINVFLSKSLAWFHAYYKVLRHDNPAVFFPGRTDEEVVLVQSRTRAPSADDRENAKRLTHSCFLDLLDECIQKSSSAPVAMIKFTESRKPKYFDSNEEKLKVSESVQISNKSDPTATLVGSSNSKGYKVSVGKGKGSSGSSLSHPRTALKRPRSESTTIEHH